MAKNLSNDDLTAWERVKKAFANDWEQTKADMGVKGARDMNQDVDDTLKQAAGSDDSFENREQAFRFGHASRSRYRSEHAQWSDELEKRLRADYEGDYDADRRYIRHSYEYKYAE